MIKFDVFFYENEDCTSTSRSNCVGGREMKRLQNGRQNEEIWYVGKET